MADAASATGATPTGDNPPANPSIIFGGTTQNFVPGIALLFAGIMAFSMGLTDVFFAEATAWTFIIWGALFVYGGLLDINNVYEVTDEALIIRNPFKIWSVRRTWDWGRVNRLDVVVKRADGGKHNIIMQTYYTPEGELALDREDRPYDAALAALIVERAGLKPADKETPKDVTKIPTNAKATFTWR